MTRNVFFAVYDLNTICPYSRKLLNFKQCLNSRFNPRLTNRYAQKMFNFNQCLNSLKQPTKAKGVV